MLVLFLLCVVQIVCYPSPPHPHPIHHIFLAVRPFLITFNFGIRGKRITFFEIEVPVMCGFLNLPGLPATGRGGGKGAIRKKRPEKKLASVNQATVGLIDNSSLIIDIIY